MPEITPPAVEPAAPAAPEPAAAPAEPVASPPAEPASATPTPPADERTDDEKEWDDAEDELFPKGENNEPAEPKEAVKKEGEGETPGEAKKPDEESDNPDETPKTEVPQSDAARDARLAARAAAQEVEAVKADVIEKLFANVPTELVDVDGDPIRTVQDVMARINPKTGEAFTENEAEVWLLSAKQQFATQQGELQSRAAQIAEVNVNIKDEADSVNSKYHEILEANPDLRAELWAAFDKTLIKDPETGIIIDMPVSLEMFYGTALKPYATVAANTAANEKAAAEAAEAEAAKAKAEEEAARHKKRTDRSDIYAGGKTDTLTSEDKEWAEAEKEVLGI
jgi:hypothetical protein